MTDVLSDSIAGMNVLCSVCTDRHGDPVFICALCARPGVVTSYCHRCSQRFMLTHDQLVELFPLMESSAVPRSGLVLSFSEQGGCPGCETSKDWTDMHYRSFSLS